jgi:hypothetical protein
MVNDPELINVEKGSAGFFSLIEQYCRGEHLLQRRPFHRLCTLMRKMNVGSVIVESIESNAESVLTEVKALNIYYNKHSSVR